MKKMIAMLAIAFAVSSNHTDAQVRVNINIGAQPVWGPTGYDYVDYYYLPEYDVYYNVPQRQWAYFSGGRWMFGAALPPRYHVNLYNTYKVVVNEPRPYMRADYYRGRYANYRSVHNQVIIRDSRDSRYFVNRGHPRHNEWVMHNGPHNNGPHYGGPGHGGPGHDGHGHPGGPGNHGGPGGHGVPGGHRH